MLPIRRHPSPTMKPIDKDELYEHLSSFLRSKGVDLREGAYTSGIQKSCSLVAEVVNSSKETIEKARGEIDKKLDQVRQIIHDKTAPKPAPAQPAAAKPEPPPAPAPSPAPAPAASAAPPTPPKPAKSRKTTGTAKAAKPKAPARKVSPKK